MKFLIRADSSKLIGSGHIRRCLTLAIALRNRGADCRFACRDLPGSSIELIRNSKFDVVVIGNENRGVGNTASRNSREENSYFSFTDTDWHVDRDQVITAIGDEGFDWLIVDHYGLDFKWESSLRPFSSRIMVIDDLANRKHDCDLLLDQNLVKDFEHRYDSLVASECHLLLSPKYALIDPIYGELHQQAGFKKGPAKHFLVSFGGTDNANLTGKVVQAFTELNVNGTTMDVVLSPDTPYFTEVSIQVRKSSNVRLFENLPNLAYAMLNADFSIGAAGITSWERCCLGLPSIVITIAENQRAIAEELSKRGLIQWAGDSTSITVDAIKQQLISVFENASHENCSRALTKIADGLGVHRVATLLLLSGASKLNQRLATIDDEKTLLRWVNDPTVRENSFCSDIVTRESHHSWFINRIENPSRYRIYMICDEHGEPVGQVRFELTTEGWKIGYSLAGIARGKHLGHLVLDIAMCALRTTETDPIIYGDVKAANRPSTRVFEKLGFFMTENKQTGVLRFWNREIL